MATHEPTEMVFAYRNNKKHEHKTRRGIQYWNHWYKVYRCPVCGRHASHKPKPIICRGTEATADKARREPTFEEAWRNMPACVDTDPLRMKTLDDLRWACLLQLDLIEEGQDGTEDDDPEAIRGWLKRYGRPKTN